jgi:hypothetical protein
MCSDDSRSIISTVVPGTSGTSMVRVHVLFLLRVRRDARVDPFAGFYGEDYREF